MSGILRALSPFFHPVGFAWLLLIATAALCARRKRPLGTAMASAAALALWVLGQPRLVHPLYRLLETPWMQATATQAPDADAIIVLGGGWRTSPPELHQIDFTEASDRFITGLELCRTGRAPVLVLGGDAGRPNPRYTAESSRLRHFARAWGLATQEILTLGPVHTTADEAERARELVRQRGWKRVLLVTSAFHMRRAAATFRRAGVPIHPVACDFRFTSSPPLDRPRWEPAPTDGALGDFSLWWHEQLGWAAYRLAGRL